MRTKVEWMYDCVWTFESINVCMWICGCFLNIYIHTCICKGSCIYLGTVSSINKLLFSQGGCFDCLSSYH